MSDKTDFRSSLDAYQARRDEIRVVDVPDLRYLMIDGRGDPNTSPDWAEAVSSLYPVAYRTKFASRAGTGRDYVVPPLEGLWWADDMDSFTTRRDPSRWLWTLMLMVPHWVDDSVVLAAVREVGARRRPPRLDDVRLETLSEGRCVQTLHVGDFDAEADVLAQLHHDVIPRNGFVMSGKHHEIYLSDFRRVPVHKRRTILRQPVLPVVEQRR